VEVSLSALILGPLLTTVPLGHYFTSHEFGLYMLNVTGHIHYLLPGVFKTNPYNGIVNAQLWTVPYELMSYIALAVLTVVGIKRRSWLAPAAVLALSAVFFGVSVLKHKAATHDFGTTPGAILIICFLAGLSVFLYKDRLPWNHGLTIASGIVAVALFGFVPYGVYLAAPFAAYFTVSLGVYDPAKLHMLQGNDYSYGMYIYGFVIQQTLVAVFPVVKRVGDQHRPECSARGSLRRAVMALGGEAGAWVAPVHRTHQCPQSA
jgi:peptidoglycan/LPS O-acetylase OafA/YrhL